MMIRRLGIGMMIMAIGLAIGQVTTRIKISQVSDPPRNWVEKSLVFSPNMGSDIITVPDTIAVGTQLWLVRNGLVQAEGLDYSFDGIKTVKLLFPGNKSADDTWILRWTIVAP